MSTSVAWEHELQSWLEPFLKPLRHPARRRMCPLYVAGLIGPGERKSLQPMAARVAPADYDQLHHFVAVGPWDEAPLEAELLAQANRLVGGPDAILVIDDTALPKKGTHSVGVASQYAGALGKKANCQSLVSLTLAKGEVPIPIVLRLFLPDTWITDPERLQHAGVPEAFWVERSKPEIALEELQRVMQAGVSFGAVLADAGYGISAPFRQGCRRSAALGGGHSPHSEGVSGRCAVGPATRHPRRTAQDACPGSGGDCGRSHAGEELMASDHLATRHQGAAAGEVRGRARAGGRWARGASAGADRPASARRRGLAGGRAPLVGRAQVLPVQPAARHSTEAAGLSHQGALGVRAGASATQGRARARSLRGPLLAGLHRHALMTLIAYLFLQHLRLQAAKGEKKKTGGPPPQPTLPAIRRMLLDHMAHAMRLRCPICRARFTLGLTDESAKVVLGRVDGFDQDEAQSKGDKGGVVLVGFLAP